MIALPDVDALMAGGLQAQLDARTAERAAARDKARTITIWAAVLAAASLATGALMHVPQVGFMVAGAVGLILLAWADRVRRAMITRLKEDMNGALADALEIEYSVVPVPGPEFDLGLDAGILPDHDNAQFQDLWRGKIEDTDFTLYEATLTEQRGSGKNRRTVTVFQGIILRLQFARGFSGTTLVRRNKAIKISLFGDAMTVAGQRLERIRMVDPEFESVFDVYGSDQVEARYLVHPAYCERLLSLESNFAGEQLAALFHDGDLLVTIHCDELFESASMDPAEDRERLGRSIAQFGAIALLVKQLNERPRS